MLRCNLLDDLGAGGLVGQFGDDDIAAFLAEYRAHPQGPVAGVVHLAQVGGGRD